VPLASDRNDRFKFYRPGGGARIAPDAVACTAIDSYSRIYNYSADAGSGSNTITTISESPGWRAALLGTVAAGALWLGDRAHAACTGAGTYTCTGTLTTTQTLTGTPLTVTTVAPLSVITVAGDAFDLTGTGGLSFTDLYASTVINGATDGILATNNVSGALSITTTGAVTGGNFGIFARNYGTGALEIVANGDVASSSVGVSPAGIFAYNSAVSMGDLSIITGAGTTVTGDYDGILAVNAGAGALTIVANGDVTAGVRGIDARNYGTGALSITAKGDVTGTDLSGIGIYAGSNGVDSGTGKSLSILTEATVTGVTNGIFARNNGSGALEIVAKGDVTGTAAASTGIFARSTAASNGPLSITTYGAVTGGNFGINAINDGAGALEIVVNSGGAVAGGNAGVEIVNGTANSLKNYGSIANLTAVTGTAILAGTGDETVDNFGVVTGSVDLGGGSNAFTNHFGGVFNSGPTVNLGAGNVLTNAGTIDPGDPGNVVTTTLTGNFVQSSSGVFHVDIDGANADRIDVSGSAALAGSVKPVFSLFDLVPGRQWTILTTGAPPILNNGIGVDAPPATLFDLIFPTPAEMDLIFGGVNFALSGLNRNETAIANNLNAIYFAGTPPKLQPLVEALALLPSVNALANALDQLSPEVYLDTEIAQLFSQLGFADTLMTCPVREGAQAFIKEGECLWARGSGRAFDQDATFQTLGFDETSWQFATGAQLALAPSWRLGGAFAYEHSDLKTDTNAKTEGDRFDGGAVLKYNPGALLLAAGVSGGVGSYDAKRPIGFTGFSARAQGDSDIGAVDGRFRAAYLLTSGAWYAKPMVDLDVTWLGLDGTNERGGGGAALKVRGTDETVFSASPALEIGTQWAFGDGTLLRPYARAGATVFGDNDFAVLASFEQAPGGIGPFRIATHTDDVVADIGAGIDIIGRKGAELKLFYEGRFGDLVSDNAGGLKASIPF
jgi:hypothetical protein